MPASTVAPGRLVSIGGIRTPAAFVNRHLVDLGILDPVCVIRSHFRQLSNMVPNKSCTDSLCSPAWSRFMSSAPSHINALNTYLHPACIYTTLVDSDASVKSPAYDLVRFLGDFNLLCGSLIHTNSAPVTEWQHLECQKSAQRVRKSIEMWDTLRAQYILPTDAHPSAVVLRLRVQVIFSSPSSLVNISRPPSKPCMLQVQHMRVFISRLHV